MSPQFFRLAFCALTFVGMVESAVDAQAAPTYTVTNLGGTYALMLGDSALVQVSSVQGEDGSRYKYEKSTITYIYEDVPDVDHPGNSTNYRFQSGSYKTGYYFNADLREDGVLSNPVVTPVFQPSNSAWGYILAAGSNPVNDINTHGQVVGSSQLHLLSDPLNVYQTYAAFSDVTGMPHGYDPANPTKSLDASVLDNLNNYIAQNLGIYLTGAVGIDELGQIIARGVRDGQQEYFLLTPDGQPVPVPEPSALALALTTLPIGLGFAWKRRRMAVVA
ncbi:PEP-CTERM sorting domain-containing protein [Singulisphaera sp. Ch08]|uniref:PEP-CTERM sorting domain-containing protein n=1 Tax=Singulisphaera sp. Ch08 TaxID=3120278 RepID=A0AAU7CJK7_9BACT